LMDYEGADSAVRTPELVAQLPSTMRSPDIPDNATGREWGTHQNPP
jgi:hypothetical protein